jgi:hypothetical protein
MAGTRRLNRQPFDHLNHPEIFPHDPAAQREAMRRLAKISNSSELEQANRVLMLPCEGGCGRRIAKLMRRPRPAKKTPDGMIEPDFFNDGPVLTILGPVEVVGDEYHLVRRESVTAPGHLLGLRGRADQIVIVCSCEYRHGLDPVLLTAIAEAVTVFP